MATATASGGAGGSSFGSEGGAGGDATATASSAGSGGGIAAAMATARGGSGAPAIGGTGVTGAANATSYAATTKGALAQAQSTAVGSSGQAQSTAQTNVSRVTLVQATATAPVESMATTNATAQGGGAGPLLGDPGQTAYATAIGLPSKAYLTTQIGGAGNVATALLGPRDVVFGSAIMGANYASDGGEASLTYSATSTFDFSYRGDLLLGLIGDEQDGFAGGVGFQSLEFYVLANRAKIRDWTFTNLTNAESFFQNNVIDLGSNLGPAVDLTFGYKLIADGSGGFGFDFAVADPPGVSAVPEPSTWTMLLIGFAGLGFTAYRRARTEKASWCP